VFFIGLNHYEKRLIQVLEEHPKINTREFIRLAGLGKTTFYKYSESLETAGYMSYEQIKNERIWYLRKAKRKDLHVPNFEESKKYMENRYEQIESKVLQSLRRVREDDLAEKLDVYSNAILLILGTLDSMKLVSIYNKKRVPDIYVKFTKKLERLLEKISDEKFFSSYGLGRAAIESIALESENKLDEFLRINADEGKKTSARQ
jgi:hypothetical protein